MNPTPPALRLFRRAALPLESALLLLVGLALLIAGAALLPVSAGRCPFNESGLHGLLLVLLALQTVALGKTPLGDAPRTRGWLAAGLAVAAVGIATCFSPGLFKHLPRWLLALWLGLGGLLLLLRMALSPDKLRAWLRGGCLLRRLAAACAAVYAGAMLLGLLIAMPNLLPLPLTAAALLAEGAALIWLAALLRAVYGAWPEAETPPAGPGELPADRALILLTALFMLILGGLLLPVSAGAIPFSASAQLGLLMVIFAVQMLASGSTPIGSFPRSWLMVGLGLGAAAAGMVSCMVPDTLVPGLTALVGTLNILGGAASLARLVGTLRRSPLRPGGPLGSLLLRLGATQAVMGLLTLLFGASMLVPRLAPGWLLGIILAANGGLLLYLLRLLAALDAAPAAVPRD